MCCILTSYNVNCCTGAKSGWRLAWETMVRELAPQDQTGNYSRPSYAFDEQIGTAKFPVSDQRRDKHA